MTVEQFLAATRCLGGGTTESGWTLNLAITLPLLAVATLYGTGSYRLWHRAERGRGLRQREAICFAAGWATLAVALVTPLHALGELLFSAHMIEHELLMAVAAPLLALSRPVAALLWGLPSSWRKTLGRAGHVAPVAALWGVLTRPVVATLLHGIAIWIWHVPVLFQAALEQGVLHYLQHASFFGTGLFFWWVLLPIPGRQSRNGAAVMHLFFTSLHTGLLGVLLTFAPRLWYPANAAGADIWGLTPLEDQQLAGLVMWVPAGLIYAGAALLLAGLWISGSGRLASPLENAYALRSP